jgi:hypothetical protein
MTLSAHSPVFIGLRSNRQWPLIGPYRARDGFGVQFRGRAELPKNSAAGCNELTSHMTRKTSAAKIILGWTTGTGDG